LKREKCHTHSTIIYKTLTAFGLSISSRWILLFFRMREILTPIPVPHHDPRNTGGAEDETMWGCLGLRGNLSTTYGRVKSEAGFPRCDCPVGAIRRHCISPALQPAPNPTMSQTELLHAALNDSIASGRFIDTKFYVFSRRDKSGRVGTPKALFANSRVLTTVPYFETRKQLTLSLFFGVSLRLSSSILRVCFVPR